MNNHSIDKEHIWDIIKSHIGEGNAINQHEVTDEYIYRSGFGISERVVRRLIRELRQDGKPILSSPHWPSAGYFVPATVEEVEDWQERMHSKAIALMAIIKPVIGACQEMFPGKVEQLEMFGNE
jgi:hypothetical protein